jgi:multidrug transporter EmrE-like cation transporter
MTSGARHINLYALIVVAALLGAVADGFINHWAKHQRLSTTHLLFGVIAWNGALFLFARVLTTESLARAATLFLVANGVLAAIISVGYFRESLSWQSLLGIVLALVGVAVMEAGR